MNNSPSLFTFGDSSTRWWWPTYADYLAAGFHKSINAGQPGAGNRCIFNTIGTYLNNEEFQEGDVVIINWTSLCREDRILPESTSYEAWGRLSIEEKVSSSWLYPPEFAKNYYSLINNSVELINYIKFVELAFKQLKVHLFMTTMLDYNIGDVYGESSSIGKLVNRSDKYTFRSKGYEFKLNSITSKFKIRPSLEEYRWQYKEKDIYTGYIEHDVRTVTKDTHPNPITHWNYARDRILPILKKDNIPFNEEAFLESRKIAETHSDFFTNREKVEEFYKQFKHPTADDYRRHAGWPADNILRNYSLEFNLNKNSI